MLFINLSEIINLLLCTYALTGCDTVSFLFKKGKSSVVKKFLPHAGDEELQALLKANLDFTLSMCIADDSSVVKGVNIVFICVSSKVWIQNDQRTK